MTGSWFPLNEGGFVWEYSYTWVHRDGVTDPWKARPSRADGNSPWLALHWEEGHLEWDPDFSYSVVMFNQSGSPDTIVGAWKWVPNNP